MSDYRSFNVRKMADKVGMDRRVRKVKRFFWSFRDDINLGALVLWTFLLGVVGVLVFDRVLELFR